MHALNAIASYLEPTFVLQQGLSSSIPTSFRSSAIGSSYSLFFDTSLPISAVAETKIKTSKNKRSIAITKNTMRSDWRKEFLGHGRSMKKRKTTEKVVKICKCEKG